MTAASTLQIGQIKRRDEIKGIKRAVIITLEQVSISLFSLQIIS